MFALANRAWAVAALLVAGCNADIANGPKADPKEMAGAGGRDIAEYWPSLDIPLSQNTRMLSADMLKAEVMRATGRSWVVSGIDQLDKNRGALGGADFKTTFADDLTPSQQRMVLIRKMAFGVCGDVVTAEAGAATRTVFTELDPGAAFDSASPGVETQIKALFHRFFLADATADDVSDGKALLHALSPDGANGKTAWRGLCVSYLASMRFLSY